MSTDTESVIIQPTQTEVDLITKYAEYADIFEAPLQAHEAVMRALIAAIVNPNVFIQNGGQKLSLDFWTVLLSGSGVGRNTLVGVMRDLLENAGLNEVLKNNSWGSAQGLYQDLAEQPSGFFVWEELAAYLKTLSDARFGNAKVWLTDRYDNFALPDDIQYRRAGRSNDTPPIEFSTAPRTNILATSSHEWFVQELNEADSLGGFIPRWFIVDLPKSDRCVPTPRQPDKTLVKPIIDTLNRVKALKGPVDLSQIQARYEEWYRSTKARFEEHEQRHLASAFWNRHRVHLLKLAAIYQLSRSASLTVSPEALERAIETAREAENTIVHLLSSGFSKEGSAMEKMYEAIDHASEKGLPKSFLTRAFSSTPEYIREPRLRTLIDSERVYSFFRTILGRRAEDLVADKFVEAYQQLHPEARKK